MKTTWFKGVEDAQEKDDVRSSFKSSSYIRKRLAEILADRMEERERITMSDDSYDNPSWAYKMADAQGYKRALSEIISLIVEK